MRCLPTLRRESKRWSRKTSSWTCKKPWITCIKPSSLETTKGFMMPWSPTKARMLGANWRRPSHSHFWWEKTVWLKHKVNGMMLGKAIGQALKEPAYDLGKNTNFILLTTKSICPAADTMYSAVPTMLMVEKAVRGIKKGKAGGIDGICPDAVRLGGTAAARRIFTLATKELVRGQVPLIDRGGIALPLYKHKGPQSARSSFRSIVLENCIGKTVSRLWRPELEAAFCNLAGSAQGGAKKGMGPVTHIVRARVLQKRAFLSGESFGIILLDMESAFYKAVRQLVVKADDFERTDEYVAHMSKNLGIGPKEHQVFYQHLRECPMLEKGNANKAIQKWVLSSMEGSWCKLRDSAQCLATSLGTKPGDPTADVLYSLVMTKFLQTISQKFRQRPELKGCTHAMTWVDDVILPFQARASEIHQKAGIILSIMHDTATSMGMVPNLRRGKTEVMLGFAGEGSQQSKRSFEMEEPSVWFHTLRGDREVEVVPEATYLGAILEAKGRLMPEIVSCTGRAHSSVRPLKKAVLGNTKIPMNQRRAVLQALALSKSGYTIGAWLPMKRAEEKAWSSRTMKTLRLLVPTCYDKGEHLTDEEVLVKTGSLSPKEMISMATLRLCGMLAQWADDSYLEPFLDSLSTEEDTWMTQATKEVEKLGQKTRTGWGHLTTFADVLRVLSGPQAQSHMNKCIAKYTKALLHEREQTWLIQKRHSMKGLSHQIEMQEGQEDYPCKSCAKVFKSKAALGVHNFQIHGHFCEAYSYAATTTCFSCLGQYHSRERLVRHLQWGSMDCLEKIKGMVEPLTKEQILYLNERDKEKYREAKRQGKRHVNETRTFCRGNISEITDITGDWSDFFAEKNMSTDELAELQALETWILNGPLLELYEEMPDSVRLEEALSLITQVASNVNSGKVLLAWAMLIQQDLFQIYEGSSERSDCMAAWAKARTAILDRFFWQPWLWMTAFSSCCFLCMFRHISPEISCTSKCEMWKALEIYRPDL